MISRDARCVFVASDAAQAAVVVNWLEHQNVPAQVMDTMTLGGLDGLTAWTGISARGIEVWVLREEDIDAAKQLLAQHQQDLASLLAAKVSAGPVSARCEECGRYSVFGGEERGTVQYCPHCGEYLDVPDGDLREGEGEENSTDAEVELSETEPAEMPAQSPSISGLRRLQKPIILFFLGAIAIYVMAIFLAGASSFFRQH